jgi:hypothetical protein
VIRLTQTEDIELLLELIWDNGGWVGCVLDHKGMTHKTKSLIMPRSGWRLFLIL